MKKPLFFAALLAAFALLPLAAQTGAGALTDWTVPGDFEFFPEGNGLTITKYKGKAAVVNIPLSIDGIPVMAIGDSAFSGCSSLTGKPYASALGTGCSKPGASKVRILEPTQRGSAETGSPNGAERFCGLQRTRAR
jgi:hypothetical protein